MNAAEWFVTLVAIGIIVLMIYSTLYTAFNDAYKDTMKRFEQWEKHRIEELSAWADSEVERRFQERLHNTRWEVTANVELVNESDIKWD